MAYHFAILGYHILSWLLHYVSKITLWIRYVVAYATSLDIL